MARTICTGDMRARQTELDTKMAKTYNSGDSLVVTHLTTNPPVSCLSTAERTGSAGVSYSDATKVPKMTVFGNICQ
jgi:hypothetical protein